MELCQTKDMGLRSYTLLLQILIWLWERPSLKRFLGPENLVIIGSGDQRAISLCCVTLGNFLSLDQGRKICILDLIFLRTKTYYKSTESKWAFNRKRMLHVFFLSLLTLMRLASLYLWKPDRNKILIPKMNLRDFSLHLYLKDRAISGSSCRRIVSKGFH